MAQPEKNDAAGGEAGGHDEHAVPLRVLDRRHWVSESGELSPAAGCVQDEAGGKFPTYVEELLSTIADKDRRIEELASSVRSMRGAVDEARKRVERDAEQSLARAKEDLVIPMLDAVDNLERCVASASDKERGMPVVQGARLAFEFMLARLREMGFERFEPLGDKFDPAVHEALAVAASEPEKDGTVVAVHLAGYRTSSRVVRLPRVVVGKYQK